MIEKLRARYDPVVGFFSRRIVNRWDITKSAIHSITHAAISSSSFCIQRESRSTV